MARLQGQALELDWLLDKEGFREELSKKLNEET